MSDVYSFGVVLLELLTGRRSVDKTRPSREQDLVEWARPQLKDPYKLERIMDPRLEGQYSTEAARKLAALAHQCLSHHAKCRPTMRNVVKTLEPLMNLTDFPVGHFVYVVPAEGENNGSSKQNKKDENVNTGRNCEKKCEEEEKEKEKEKKKTEKNRQRRRKSHKKKIKPLRRRAVYSDTTLYKTLGTSLYSSTLRPEAKGDGELLA